MSTPEYERWTALTVRKPSDVRTEPGGPVPLTWQMEKLAQHQERLSNRRLPADFAYEVERGDAGDVLGALAIGESIRRDIDNHRALHQREAIELGATWDQVAAAIGGTPEQARAHLREWADGQHNLWLSYEGQERRFGLDDQEHAAVLALCAQGLDSDSDRD